MDPENDGHLDAIHIDIVAAIGGLKNPGYGTFDKHLDEFLALIADIKDLTKLYLSESYIGSSIPKEKFAFYTELLAKHNPRFTLINGRMH